VNLSGLLTAVNAKRTPETPSAADADAAPNDLTLALAYWLNAFKDERGLSVRGFAALTGLSHAYCRRVLKGDANVGLGMLAVIARAIGKDPLDLLKPPSPSHPTKTAP
jgi:hypothetical protein